MPLPPLPPPKRLSTRLLAILKGTVSFLVLIPLLLVINVFQMASFILLRPFSAHAFRRFNRWCANFWWGTSHLWGVHLWGLRTEISGDPIPPEENAIVIANHQEMGDIPTLFKIAYDAKRLGDLKWFVKDILKYVPAIGWGMIFLDCLFVKRNWTADKDYIHGVFANVLKNKIPLWIISFTEGTRIKPSKLKRSNEYAEKNGHKPTQHVLLPRTKGFTTTVLSLSTHLDAVYDVTIAYVDGVPTIWQWFEGLPRTTYLHVRRFPVSTLPQDEEALSAWLMQRFYKKDQLLDQYYEQGPSVFQQDSPQNNAQEDVKDD